MKEIHRIHYWQRKWLCQSGQSMAENLWALFAALWIILGTIQLALVFHAKITLNFAAYEAARYASLENAQRSAAVEGFARGLAPLYSYYEPDKKKRDKMKGKVAQNQVEAFQIARDKIYDEIGDDKRNILKIERLSPSEQAFSDYAEDEEIPNDNLMYRATQPGKLSKTTIQDANLLHLRITYCYPLYVPLINNFIYDTFICNKNQRGYEKQPCCKVPSGIDDPRIPITVVSAIRMQSPAKKSKEEYD